MALNFEKEILTSKLESRNASTDFGTALEEVLSFFKSPYEYYCKGDVHDKRLAFDLVFMSKIPFDYEKGFGTADYSDLVKVFQQIVSESPVRCTVVDGIRTQMSKLTPLKIHLNKATF